MTAQNTLSRVGLKYGVILGIMFIIYGSLLQFLNLDIRTANYLGWVMYIGLLITIIIAIKDYKKKNNQFMAFGQGLGLGTLLSLVSGVLSGIFTYLYVKFIDRSMLEKIRDVQIVEMEKQELSDAQMEKAMEMMDTLSGPGVIAVSSVLMIVFLGFIFSLIVSAIMKNESAEHNILNVE